MGYCYTFIRPHDMKIIDKGKFSGMPFYWNDLPINVPMFPDSKPYQFNECYEMTGIMDRHIAEQLQSIMADNKTLFTDMMDEYNTECLIFRIE